MEDKATLNEYMLKEIDIVQDIIKRMAFNSFVIKGWAVTLVVVVLLFKGEKYHAFIAFIPLLSFWYLDAYFLRKERMYRELYKWIIDNRLKTNERLFDMSTCRFKDEVQSKFKIMFSITLGCFYGSIAFLLIVFYLMLCFFN